eukprot:gene4570-9086_t
MEDRRRFWVRVPDDGKNGADYEDVDAEIGTSKEQQDESGQNATADESSEGTTLHIANLTRNVKEEHLQEIFSTYGPVDLVIDKRVGLSKGNAYVEFEKAKDAEDAMLHMDGGQLDGHILKVSYILVNKRRRESPERIPVPSPRRRSPSPRTEPSHISQNDRNPPRNTGYGARQNDVTSRGRGRGAGPGSDSHGKYGPSDGGRGRAGGANGRRRTPSPRDRNRDREFVDRDRDRRGDHRGPPRRSPPPPSRLRGPSPRRRYYHTIS